MIPQRAPWARWGLTWKTLKAWFQTKKPPRGALFKLLAVLAAEHGLVSSDQLLTKQRGVRMVGGKSFNIFLWRGDPYDSQEWMRAQRTKTKAAGVELGRNKVEKKGKKGLKSLNVSPPPIWRRLTLLIQKVCSQLFLFRGGYWHLLDLDILKFYSPASAREPQGSFG